MQNAPWIALALITVCGCGGGSTGTTPMCNADTPIDDNNPCTTDACDDTAGITHTPISGCTTPISQVGAPLARRHHTAVWSGTEMIVWGGTVAGTPPVTATGGRFDPVRNAWTATSASGAPPARHSHCSVWTGKEMLVWGGYGLTALETTGGAYDPAVDTWRSLSTTGAPGGRTGFTCTWTGTAMLVWGGSAGATTRGDGASYDPATDTWKPLPAAGAPSPRYNHSAAWSDHTWLLWGGNDLFNWHVDGAIFDPAAGTWKPMATAGAPTPREAASAFWTGGAMTLWGGWTGGVYAGDGASYDPVKLTWTPLAAGGAPSPRQEHAAVWTGSSMLIWGGCGMDTCAELYADGAVWTPGAGGGAWRALVATPDLAARRNAAAVWTGGAMAVWGGKTAQGETDTGALLYP